MWPYWLIFVPAVILALSGWGGADRDGRGAFWLWLVVGIVLVLFVGLRHEVGGDWDNYLQQYQTLTHASLVEALRLDDPGYGLLNWLSGRLGLGIHAVNLVAATIFVYGLIVFCRLQPNPWLALVVAIPYIVFVIAMGYTRQGVALGILFLALSYLQNGRLYAFLAAIALAALFHKTALVMAPLGLFAHRRGWLLHVFVIGVAIYGLWDLLLAKEQERLWELYVEQAMESEGAGVRAYMNVLPACLVLLFWRRWKVSVRTPWLWLVLAIAAFVSALLVGQASTAIDRLALYLTPLQLVVFSRLPRLSGPYMSAELATLSVIFLYAAVAVVWFNFATHAQYWLPYQNLLFL